MFSTIGPKVYEVSQDILRSTGVIITPTVHFIPTPFQYDKGDQNLQFSKMLNVMSTDYARNNVILNELNKIGTGDFSLVLGDSLAHLQILQLDLAKRRPDLALGFVHGKTPKAQRESTMEAMRNQQIRVLFATYQLAKEGLDLPCLNKLFLTTPKRDKVVIQQSVGRIMRKSDGKDQAHVYDFYDGDITTCYYQAKARLEDVYIPLGCKVIGQQLLTRK
jgi:superfamily II DNA or RNA helicase